MGDNDFRGMINNCYSSGAVASGIDSDFIGGLIGYNYYRISLYSYWDIETSGLTESSGGEGKTTSQMKDIDTFSHWSANPAVWTIDDGNDYPHLALEQLPGQPINSPLLSDLLIGQGTQSQPYLVSDANDLEVVGGYLNQQQEGIHFKLISDVNLSGQTYTKSVIPLFSGIFDGADFKISNLNVYSVDGPNEFLGLFGKIEDSGQVKHLGIEDVNVTAGDNSYYLGGLAGNNTGTIINCYSTGSVTGDSRYLGGLTGCNPGVLSNCHSTCAVTGGYLSHYLGGLTGYNTGTLSNCHANGAINGWMNSSSLGGLVGWNEAKISNCYAIGPVFGRDGSYYLGGLVGDNGHDGDISNCYATGDVTSLAFSHYIGGLVGNNVGSIDNCYSSGEVSGHYDVGGLVGYNFRGTISNCFWDEQTSNMEHGVGGSEDGTITNLLGKTTAEMQTQSTFTDYDWDFVGEIFNGTENIWHMSYKTTGYPMLYWQKDIPGDITSSYNVNLADFAMMANAWFSTRGENKWNGLCDLYPDDLIEWLDLQTFAENWLNGLYHIPGDIAGSYGVNFFDFAVLANTWKSTPSDNNWNVLCDLYPDDVINWHDLQTLSENWLNGL